MLEMPAICYESYSIEHSIRTLNDPTPQKDRSPVCSRLGSVISIFIRKGLKNLPDYENLV